MGILMDTICTEADLAFHEVFEVAMESSTIPTKVRKSLPDSAFGLIYKDENGEKQRKYPLIVKSDLETSRDLQRKAVAFFHFCAPQYKKELAKKIVDAIVETESGVKISPKSQIVGYVNMPTELLGEEFKYKKT